MDQNYLLQGWIEKTSAELPKLQNWGQGENWQIGTFHKVGWCWRQWWCLPWLGSWQVKPKASLNCHLTLHVRILDSSNKQLEDGRRLLAETEQIGGSVLEDLSSQRETLQRARGRLKVVFYYCPTLGYITPVISFCINQDVNIWGGPDWYKCFFLLSSITHVYVILHQLKVQIPAYIHPWLC